MAPDSRTGTRGRRDGTDTRPPLVESKLAAPRLRSTMVERPRIRLALDAGSDAALTLVAAPAGYGKTTAVRAWSAGLDAAQAWVTLDAGDNDPARLWRYVATAVDRVRRGLGQASLRRLSVPASPIEDVVDELMNGIRAFPSRLAIVLDDLHTVTSAECLSSIDHALAHLPHNASVIAITRADPALGLARLRAAGALAELRADELAFTSEEAHELVVVRTHVQLGMAEVGVLVERTEGWAAALVLAGLWLRAVDDPVRAVRAFGGDNRFVAEYLSGEVLASLDEHGRSFLQGIAVLGVFTAELCDWVFDRTDSAVQLAALERANLFVSRLEQGGWFRVHSLFSEYARAQLDSLDPAAAARVHRRAAEWLRSRSLPAEAVEHAAAAGDHELVAQLLVEYHVPLIRNGAGGTFLRWARILPDEYFARYPVLAGAAAVAALVVGESTTERRRFLRLAEQSHGGRSGHADPYVEAGVRTVHAFALEGGVGRAVVEARRAVELARTDSDDILPFALSAQARALFFAGDPDGAMDLALRALEHPDVGSRVPSLVVAHATLALVAVERGRLASARSHAEQATAAVGRFRVGRSWLGANASAALGAVLAAEGNLPEAERAFVSAEHVFRDEVATLHHTWLLVLLARVRLRRGHLDQAEATLRVAREALDELRDNGFVPARAEQAAQELETARARARGGDVIDPPSERELAVLRLLASDLSTREIAARLFVSPNTIRSHKRAIYHKLAVHTQADATARAIVLGLLDQAESPG